MATSNETVQSFNLCVTNNQRIDIKEEYIVHPSGMNIIIVFQQKKKKKFLLSIETHAFLLIFNRRRNKN